MYWVLGIARWLKHTLVSRSVPSRRLRQKGASKKGILPNSGSLRRAWLLLGAGVGRRSKSCTSKEEWVFARPSNEWVNLCSNLEDCRVWRTHLWRKASFPHTLGKCGLHVSTVRKCLAPLSISMREQVLFWLPDVFHLGPKLTPPPPPRTITGNTAVAQCQPPHLGPGALGETSGWLLDLKVPVRRAGSSGAAITVGTRRLCSCVTRWGVGSTECWASGKRPASAEPDSLSQIL